MADCTLFHFCTNAYPIKCTAMKYWWKLNYYFFNPFLIGLYEVLTLQHTWYWNIVHCNTDNSQQYCAKHWKKYTNVEGEIKEKTQNIEEHYPLYHIKQWGKNSCKNKQATNKLKCSSLKHRIQWKNCLKIAQHKK